jgi:hypothetical protein
MCDTVSIGRPHLQAVGSRGKNRDWNDPIGACPVMQHTRRAVSSWLWPVLRIQGPLRLCPCPHCFIEKEKIWKMGMKTDMRQHVDHLRVDNTSHKSKVQSARDKIYKQNYAIENDGVKNLLKPESWRPSFVSHVFAYL